MRVSFRLAAVGAAVALSVAACSSDKPAGTGTAAPGDTAAAGGAVAAATDFVAAAYSGTSILPEDTPRPRTEGRRIAIVSSGQNNPSTSTPVGGMVEACEVLGWTCDVLDGASNPGTYSGLVEQAVAADYDGIVLGTIDCPLVSAALDRARSAGIKVVGSYSFDCDDPKYNGSEKFDGQPVFQGKSLGELAEDFGYLGGMSLLAGGSGQRVIDMADNEFRILDYTAQGFHRALASDPSTEIVATVEFQAADLGPTLQRQVAEALLQHPDATAIRVPYAAAVLLGTAGAIQQSGKAGKITVIGAEGYAAELDLMRQGLVSFVNVIPGEWFGWAAVDTMNSLLTGKPVADAGIGLQLVDATHGLPAEAGSKFDGFLDYASAYRQAWGLAA